MAGVQRFQWVAIPLTACLAFGSAAPSLAASAAVAAPSQGDLDRARELYDNGRTLYEEGSWEGAIIAFERAFELSGDINLLYNISMSYDRMGDYDNAIAYLDRYRALAPEDERAKLEHKRDVLEARQKKQLEGEQQTGRDPPPKEDDPPPTGEVDDPPKRDRLFGPAAWVLTATGIVGYAVGIGFGVSSLTKTRDAQSNCQEGTGAVLCMDAARDDVDRSRNHAIGADVGFAIGAVSTVAVIIIVAIKASRRNKKEKAGANASVMPGGVQVRF